MFTEVVGCGSNAPGSNPTRANLEFSFLKNWKEIDFHEHLTSRNFKRQRNFMLERGNVMWEGNVSLEYGAICSVRLILLSQMLTWGLIIKRLRSLKQYSISLEIIHLFSSTFSSFSNGSCHTFSYWVLLLQGQIKWLSVYGRDFLSVGLWNCKPHAWYVLSKSNWLKWYHWFQSTPT